MGRFGFGKKDNEDDSKNRLALFGSRSKSNLKSPAPSTDNPYAQAAPPPPYTQGNSNAGPTPGNQGPQSNYGGYGSSNNGDQYGQGGYSATRYGNDNGYGGGAAGTNPYGGYGRGQAAPPRSGPYGGMNRADSNNTQNDAERNELFGGAPQRMQQNAYSEPTDNQYQAGPNVDDSRSYGAYGDRQLTEQEIEDEDVGAMKQDIRQKKMETRDALARSKNVVGQILQSADSTRERLHQQGDRLYNTQKNLNLAESVMKTNEREINKVERYNNRPFFVPSGNSLRSSGKRLKDEERFEKEDREERERRDRALNEHSHGSRALTERFQDGNTTGISGPTKKRDLAQRSKYQFEADSDDDRLEDEIEDGLGDVYNSVRAINNVSKALGQEIERHNGMITNIGAQSDLVEGQVNKGNYKLNRIR